MSNILSKLTALCTSSENTVTVNRSTLEAALLELKAAARLPDEDTLEKDLEAMTAERDAMAAAIYDLLYGKSPCADWHTDDGEINKQRWNAKLDALKAAIEGHRGERDSLLQKLDSYSYALEQVQQANEALRRASEGQRKVVEAAAAQRDDWKKIAVQAVAAIEILFNGNPCADYYPNDGEIIHTRWNNKLDLLKGVVEAYKVAAINAYRAEQEKGATPDEQR